MQCSNEVGGKNETALQNGDDQKITIIPSCDLPREPCKLGLYCLGREDRFDLAGNPRRLLHRSGLSYHFARCLDNMIKMQGDHTHCKLNSAHKVVYTNLPQS